MSTLDYDHRGVQNAKSGARGHHPDTEGEVLSPVEAAAFSRGQALKRYVRAAAAMQGLYDDVALANATKVKRGTVRGWWVGAQPSPVTIQRLAAATNLDLDELVAFVHFDGPPPHLPDPESEEAEAQARADHAQAAVEASEAPHAPRGKAGSGRRP